MTPVFSTIRIFGISIKIKIFLNYFIYFIFYKNTKIEILEKTKIEFLEKIKIEILEKSKKCVNKKT
jgi:hypothetical protein